MQDRAGEHRRGRDRVAEQHGEEVERDRAQQDRAVANVAEAGKQGLQGDRPAFFVAPCDADEADQHARRNEDRGAGRVDPGGTEHVEKPAERRSADHGGLLRARRGGDRARQEPRRHDAGQQRVDGRHLERAGRAGREQNRKHGVAAERTARGTDGQRERRQRLAHLAGGDDEAAIEQIGDLADDDREAHQRHELHEPDEAEIEGIVGEFIDLPADGDPLHHVGAVSEGARAPEQHERAVTRQR